MPKQAPHLLQRAIVQPFSRLRSHILVFLLLAFFIFLLFFFDGFATVPNHLGHDGNYTTEPYLKSVLEFEAMVALPKPHRIQKNTMIRYMLNKISIFSGQTEALHIFESPSPFRSPFSVGIGFINASKLFSGQN